MPLFASLLALQTCSFAGLWMLAGRLPGEPSEALFLGIGHAGLGWGLLLAGFAVAGGWVLFGADR